MKIIFIILGFLASAAFGFGQVMTKQEIYTEWVNANKWANEAINIQTALKQDSIASENSKVAINDLRRNNIDTFAFIKLVTVGFTKKKDDTNYEMYLFWLSRGKYFVQLFTHTTKSRVLEIPESHFINFYWKNHATIKNDHIIPPIYSGKRESAEIQYEGRLLIHEKEYTIACQLGNNFKLLRFGQSYFKDEKSLFFLDNISTFSYHWVMIAEAEIQTLRNKLSSHRVD